MLVPVLFAGAPLEQAGGILVLVGLLALGRFTLAIASLDTGSPFGGMGGSREMTVAALAEPALMLGLFTVALWAGSLNLGDLVRTTAQRGPSGHPSELLAAAALFIVLLAEAAGYANQVPEGLRLLAEALAAFEASGKMALMTVFRNERQWDASNVEFADGRILAYDKKKPTGAIAVSGALYAGKVFFLAVAVTLVESTNAKLRFFRVPELMALSLGLGFLALAIRFL